MKETSLKKRYIAKLLTNITNGLISAFLVAIIPKALGPIAYGQFVYLQEFFIKTIGFLDMGSSIAFFAKLSAKNERKELIVFYFLYSLMVFLILLLFVYLSDFLNILDILIPNIERMYIYFGLFFGFLTWITKIYMTISDAFALTVSVELLKVAHKIVSAFLLLIFVYVLAFDLELYFVYHYVSLLSFLLILSLLFFKKQIFRDLFHLQFSLVSMVKEFAGYCHPLVIYSIIGLLSGLFDIWILQTVAGAKEVGFYGLAYSLAAVCFLFTSAMTPIIIREFSKFYGHKDLESMRKLFYRYIPMLYSIATYFSIFVVFQSENIIMIFTDNKFADAYKALAIMALYPIHQTYGQLSGGIFYATEQTRLIRNISLFTMPLGAILSFIFIYLFDLKAEGLAYKMILGQAISVNIALYFNANLLKLDMRHFISHQFYSVCFFVFLAFFSTSATSDFSPIFSFLISGFLYTILVIISTYFFPQVFATTREEIKIYCNKAIHYVTKTKTQR